MTNGINVDWQSASILYVRHEMSLTRFRFMLIQLFFYVVFALGRPDCSEKEFRRDMAGCVGA